MGVDQYGREYGREIQVGTVTASVSELDKHGEKPIECLVRVRVEFRQVIGSATDKPNWMGYNDYETPEACITFSGEYWQGKEEIEATLRRQLAQAREVVRRRFGAEYRSQVDEAFRHVVLRTSGISISLPAVKGVNYDPERDLKRE